MAFDYSKLRGRIIEKFGTYTAFAKVLGISKHSMSQKLSGKMAITTDDIRKWSKAEYLDIGAEDIGVYFFKIKVQDN